MEPMNGTLAAGYNMCLDPAVTILLPEYNSMTVTQPLMPNTLNPFTLSQTGLTDNWFTYWASQGCNSNSTVAYMAILYVADHQWPGTHLLH